MDLLAMLRENPDLSDLLCDVCDVAILPEVQTPQDEGGHLTYNLSGKTFAKAGSGSEYILLEDGSVGYWGSEGEGGRIADSLEEFFEFVVNCPYWMDYLEEDEYQDKDDLREFAQEIFENHVESAKDSELADRLGIERKADATDLLMRFYHCTTREPRFISTYAEEDGSTHSGTGSLFDF